MTLYFADHALVALGGLGVLLFGVLGGCVRFFLARRFVVLSLQRLNDPTVHWFFTDDELGIRSELASGSLRWKNLTETGVWLLFFHNSLGYSALPTAPLNQETQTFILARARENGCKVA